MLNLANLKPPPVGFGKCGYCPYREAGPAALCFACARQTIGDLSARKCNTCDLPMEKDDVECSNPLCSFDDRWFTWNYAVAMKSGSLDAAIKRYKFDNKKGWADIFARILVGFFEDQRNVFEGFNLIVASPSYVSKDDSSKGRDWNHTRLVLEKAHVESRGEWPFDVDLAEPAIIKTVPTPRMTNNSWKQRHQIAKNELRPSLHIPDITRTKGKTILVYDDVFTDGHTLNEVARCLIKDGGAVEVCGVTLARQPWRKKKAA